MVHTPDCNTPACLSHLGWRDTNKTNSMRVSSHKVGSWKQGIKPKSCLGRVFKFKLDRLGYETRHTNILHAPTSSVENSAQVLSCSLCYKHITTVNYASRVVSEWRHNFECHSRAVNEALSTTRWQYQSQV